MCDRRQDLQRRPPRGCHLVITKISLQIEMPTWARVIYRWWGPSTIHSCQLPLSPNEIWPASNQGWLLELSPPFWPCLCTSFLDCAWLSRLNLACQVEGQSIGVPLRQHSITLANCGLTSVSDTAQVCLLPKWMLTEKPSWRHRLWHLDYECHSTLWQCVSTPCVSVFGLTGKMVSVVGTNLIYIFILGADSLGANKPGKCLDLFFTVSLQTFNLAFIAHFYHCVRHQQDSVMCRSLGQTSVMKSWSCIAVISARQQPYFFKLKARMCSVIEAPSTLSSFTFKKKYISGLWHRFL